RRTRSIGGCAWTFWRATGIRWATSSPASSPGATRTFASLGLRPSPGCFAPGFARVEVGAHGGRLLDHLTRRPTDFGQSRLYRAAERRFPALLGTTLQALAVK